MASLGSALARLNPFRSARQRSRPEPVVVTAPVDPAVTAAPPALPRFVLLLLGAALILATMIGVRQIREFVAPTFFALNMVIVVWPFQQWMVRRGLPRPVAALIAGTGVFLFLIAFFWSVGWSIALMVQELPEYRSQFESMYDQALDWLDRFGIEQQTLAEQARSVFDPGSLVGTVGDVLGGVGGFFGALGTALIVVFFLMIDSLSMERRTEIVQRAHPRLAESLVHFGQGVRSYWVVTTVFGLIVAVLDVFALIMMGVPLALVWGVLSFTTNYIPNIGLFIGMVPPVLIALLANGPTDAIIVAVVYNVINFVVQSLIQPKFTGDAIGVTTTVAFLSLLIWAWVLGPLGALLALPATLLVKAVLIDSDPKAKWADALVAANPDSEEDAGATAVPPA